MSAHFFVNEIYSCLQGEGIHLGRPSLLVRFQICNLRCSWCDTKYTHTAKSDPNAVRYTLSELCAKIQSYETFRHLILSGGEPTLQNIALVMKALGPSYTAEVESNGTQIPHKKFSDFSISDYDLMQWNISPKFENADVKIEPEALAHWAQLANQKENIFFKFVIRESEQAIDLEKILELIKQYSLPKQRVLLMPEGVCLNSQIETIWLHDICLKHGLRYSPRLHVILFGNRRGV